MRFSTLFVYIIAVCSSGVLALPTSGLDPVDSNYQVEPCSQNQVLPQAIQDQSDMYATSTSVAPELYTPTPTPTYAPITDDDCEEEEALPITDEEDCDDSDVPSDQAGTNATQTDIATGSVPSDGATPSDSVPTDTAEATSTNPAEDPSNPANSTSSASRVVPVAALVVLLTQLI